MSSAGENLTEMEKEKKNENEIGEIEETAVASSDGSSPNRNPSPKTVRTKVPEVEVHLFRRGKGPIAVFKSSLGGWDQDQLEVRDILDKYGLKSLFAFTPGSGRGVPIRFHPRNGRSMLPYKDGSVLYVDGEPKVRSFNLFFVVRFEYDSVWLERNWDRKEEINVEIASNFS